MFELTLQRLFNDLVVTMIFAPTPKRALPRVAILQLGERNDFRHTLRKRNGVGAWHGKRKRLTESIYEPGKIPNPPELGCLKLGRGTAGGRRATCKIERVDTLIEILLP